MAPSYEQEESVGGEALIPQFYAGREVLITGATGFIGQVLTERLLSTCPDIRRLHLLVRVKEDESLKTKLDKITGLQLFDVLRANNPEQLDKLHLIPGDITRHNLGMDEKSIAELHNVSVVFHLAATIKFDEELELAVKMNTLAPMYLMNICDRLPEMAAFVHVSTAYCHPERSLVEETVYPFARPLDKLIEDSLNRGQMTKNELTRLISPKVNTYTFTKSLAESAVKEHGNKGYPIVIFRPTLVTSSLRAPFPGWVQGHTGAVGVIHYVSQGFMRVMGCRHDSPIDLIPVDIAADTLIAVAWETALDNAQEVHVYNCCTLDDPITYGEMFRYSVDEARKNPSHSVLWYPFIILVSNRYLMNILEFVLEVIPMYLAAYVMKIFVKKAKWYKSNAVSECDRSERYMLDLQRLCWRLVRLRAVALPMTTCAVRFRSTRVRRLRERLTPHDAVIYSSDPAAIDWKLYFKDFIRGIRLHIIKEKIEDNSAARKRLFKLRCMHTAISLFLMLLLAWLLLHAASVCGSIAGTLGRMVAIL